MSIRGRTAAALVIALGTPRADAQSLAPPWAAGTNSPAGSPSAPPPPPPPAINGQRAQTPTARVEFVSDDTPVEVFLVVGLQEVTQLVPLAPPTPLSFTPGLGPLPWPGSLTAASLALSSAQSELVEVRSTIERRRFLCRTPCAAALPLGAASVHMRTAGGLLGTEAIFVEPNARYRARTASAGLYALGQASLWSGAGALLTGITLLAYNQSSCAAPPCSPFVGIAATSLGVLGIAAGIPLVVLNLRRLERVPNPAPTVALSPNSVAIRW